MLDFLGSNDDLSDEDKAFLIKVATHRLDYLEANIQQQRLHLQYLQNPTESNKDALELFQQTVSRPKAMELFELIKEGVARSINLEGFKQMLPMLLIVLKNNVNIQLLLGTLNIEPHLIEKLMGKLTDIIKKDSPPWNN